jgi:hypothetical protein
MEKIDIQNFKKYYRNVDGNATLARVGHLNYVIEGLTEEIAEAVTRDYVATTGLAVSSSFNKVNNYNGTVQGTEFDVYSLQGYTQLSGSNTYIYPLGYITTSSPNVGISSNSSNVLANDSFFQEMITALGVGALVTDNDPLSITFGQVIPVSLMGINIDNTVTTPDEYYIFLIAGDPVPFECDAISINLELVALKDSTVEYNVI